MLTKNHKNILVLILLRHAVILAVSILHMFLQVRQLRHFLLEVLALANKEFKRQLAVAKINWNVELEVVLMSLEAVVEIFG